MNASGTQLIADGVSTSTTIGLTFVNAMLNVPFQLLNNFAGAVVTIAVLGIVIGIGWRMWQRFI